MDQTPQGRTWLCVYRHRSSSHYIGWGNVDLMKSKDLKVSNKIFTFRTIQPQRCVPTIKYAAKPLPKTEQRHLASTTRRMEYMTNISFISIINKQDNQIC